MPNWHEVEILDEEGSSTGRIPIDGPLSKSAVMSAKNGENRFQSDVFEPTGQAVEDAQREDLSLPRAEAKRSECAMTYNPSSPKEFSSGFCWL